MKKTILLINILAFALTTSSAFAILPKDEKPTRTPTPQKTQLKDRVKHLKYTNAKVSSVNVSGFSLEVKLPQENNSTYTVKVANNTVILRKSGGKSDISEIKVGDELMILGTKSEDTARTINAKLIRNATTQKKQTSFWVKVTAIRGNNLTVETCKKDKQTIVIDAKTSIKKTDNTVGTRADIQVGSYALVNGLWSTNLSSVDATGAKQGKVFLRKNIGCFNSEKAE